MPEAIIARDENRGGWSGAYISTNGQPTNAGGNLYRQVVGDFAGNLHDAYTYYVIRHPGGWRHLGPSVADNACYCHDWRQAPSKAEDSSGPQWMYVLTSEGLVICTLASRFKSLVRWRRSHPRWNNLPLS